MTVLPSSSMAAILAVAWCWCLVVPIQVLALQQQPKIAVIGGGAAGLAAARVLSRSGLEPILLEENPNSGGVWKYHKESKTRPVYRGLRTNLPKEVMAYREYPWPTISDDPQQDPSFVTHGQVQDYLQSYQNKFELSKYIQFGCTVKRLKILEDTVSSVSPPNEKWPQFELEWEDSTQQQSTKETFDAVLICNGHYAKPAVVHLPGADEYFKGRTMHSIEYDNPQDFEGQRVLCIGARASGEDLAREISMHASHVVLSSSTCLKGQDPQTEGLMTLVPRTKEVQEDGAVLFDGYSDTSEFDVIIYCTGYDYDFPFIRDSDHIVQFLPGERRVKPLYEQLFHAQYPNLSFLGLPHSVLPFPLFEFQAEAIAAQFDSCNLPDSVKRLEAAAEDAASGGPIDDGRVQDTHFLGGYQWDYMRRLAKLAGTPDVELDSYFATTVSIWDYSSAERKGSFPGGPDTYRSMMYKRDDKNADFSIRNGSCIAK